MVVNYSVHLTWACQALVTGVNRPPHVTMDEFIEILASFANILHFVCYFYRKRVKQQIPDRETPALTEKSPHFGERFIQMQLRARELRLYDRPSKLKFWLFGSSTCTCSNCNMSSRFITWSAFCIHLSLVIYWYHIVHVGARSCGNSLRRTQSR